MTKKLEDLLEDIEKKEETEVSEGSNDEDNS